MSDFRTYIEMNMLSEQLVETIENEDLKEFVLFLDESEDQLNEFIGLNKVSNFLKNRADKKEADKEKELSDKEQKALSDIQKQKEKNKVSATKSKEFASKVEDISKKTDKFIGDVKKESKERLTKVTTGSIQAFKTLFSKIKDMSPEQKKTFDELDEGNYR